MMDRRVAQIGKVKKWHRIVVGKFVGKWGASVLAVLNLRVLLPESSLISKMDLSETGCEDGRWMELTQDRVQWRALVLAVLKLRVLLPES
jgi:hypothetical protein